MPKYLITYIIEGDPGQFEKVMQTTEDIDIDLLHDVAKTYMDDLQGRGLLINELPGQVVRYHIMSVEEM